MNKEEEYKIALELILKLTSNHVIKGICMGALGLEPESYSKGG